MKALSLIAAALLAAASSLATPAHAASAKQIPVYGVQVVHAYPHDINAFTEGLFYLNGYLYESTGLESHSSVRKVKLETGQVVQRATLPADMFGEGIAPWNGRLVGLTWKAEVGYVLDLESFDTKGQFGYPGEGWGLTHDDTEMVMSDGTADLRFLNPTTLVESHRIHVTAQGKPVEQLNELEWVDGEIYANIWQTDRIARIDPKTGDVVGWIDCKGLLPKKDFIPEHTDVLNGIAYDPATKRLFLTGKFWPKVFEVKLLKR
ncbi:MAG: glutaminyl-peptide cyclotransferase [Caulobacter sp.]|nr:glutaminyl-peptide cyclotransferase [Vitreoscilla sp.]